MAAMKKRTPDERRAGTRLYFALRVGAVVVIACVAALLGYVMLVSTSAGWTGVGTGEPRSDDERRELRASGECAVRPDGTVVGRIVSQFGATRAHPARRFVVDDLDRRWSVEVFAAEVRVVPCAALASIRHS